MNTDDLVGVAIGSLHAERLEDSTSLDHVDLALNDTDLSTPSSIHCDAVLDPDLLAQNVPSASHSEPCTPVSSTAKVGSPQLKRPQAAIEGDLVESASSNDDSDSLSRAGKRHKLGSAPSATPMSSYTYQKALKVQSITDPEFRGNLQRTFTFREKILREDRLAEFKDTDGLLVRCSACSSWVKMRLLYDLLHWKNHRKTARCIRAQAGGKRNPSLFSHFSKPKPIEHSLPTPNLNKPSSPPLPRISGNSYHCPGLSKELHPKIDQYLRRSSATGGGAPSRSKIARLLFQEYGDDTGSWTSLSGREQRLVKQRERSLYKWVNSRAVGAVFSTNCPDTVHFLRNGLPAPCDPCEALLRLHLFQVQLGRKMPTIDNFRYVPKEHRCTELGEIYLKYEGVKELLELVSFSIIHLQRSASY